MSRCPHLPHGNAVEASTRCSWMGLHHAALFHSAHGLPPSRQVFPIVAVGWRLHNHSLIVVVLYQTSLQYPSRLATILLSRIQPYMNSVRKLQDYISHMVMDIFIIRVDRVYNLL